MSKLANYRRLNNLSQSALSKKSGISIRTIQAYEQGSKDINKASINTVNTIARALNVLPEELFEKTVKHKTCNMGKTIVVGMGFVGGAVFKYLKERGMFVDSYDIKDKSVKDYSKYDSAIICVPTDYKNNDLDISNVESAIALILGKNKNIDIYVKSTLPIGSCQQIINKFKYERLFYVPEFLREKNADFDMSHPYRVVIGTNNISCGGVQKYLSLFEENVEKVITGFEEAEAIKLYSNSFLALKVAFFNEIDMVLSSRNINTKDVIHGISLDPRIGDYYNKPSYGYGGSCLPKDVKALSNATKSDLVTAIEKSNQSRKKYVLQQILERVENIDSPVVGIYSVISRKSALNEIIDALSKLDIKILVYCPLVNDTYLSKFAGTNIKQEFILKSNVILSETKCDFVSEKLLVYSN